MDLLYSLYGSLGQSCFFCWGLLGFVILMTACCYWAFSFWSWAVLFIVFGFFYGFPLWFFVLILFLCTLFGVPVFTKKFNHKNSIFFYEKDFTQNF